MHLEWGFKDGQVWLLQLDFEGEDKVGEDPKLLLNENRPKFAFEEKLYLVSVRGLYESDESVIRRPLLKS